MAGLPHFDERTTTWATYFSDYRHDGGDACDKYDYGAGVGHEDDHAHGKGRGRPAVDHAERGDEFALATGSVAQGGELGDEGDELGDEGDELSGEGDELDDEGDELSDEGDELGDEGGDCEDGDGRGLLGCGWKCGG
jgi:hypothetical protein